MPNHSAIPIANEFVRLAGGPLDQMKLQKLVYIAHGWNLAINNEPLVRDVIEAWDGGPVFRAIWDQIKFFGTGVDGLIRGWSQRIFASEAPISDSERSIIEHVWRKYGGFSGKQLSDMTHQKGTPWYEAYFKGRNTVIDNDAIRRHYLKLAQAGRERSTT